MSMAPQPLLASCSNINNIPGAQVVKRTACSPMAAANRQPRSHKSCGGGTQTTAYCCCCCCQDACKVAGGQRTQAQMIVKQNGCKLAVPSLGAPLKNQSAKSVKVPQESSGQSCSVLGGGMRKLRQRILASSENAPPCTAAKNTHPPDDKKRVSIVDSGCIKCQLIARWTSAQAKLTRSAKPPMTKTTAATRQQDPVQPKSCCVAKSELARQRKPASLVEANSAMRPTTQVTTETTRIEPAEADDDDDDSFSDAEISSLTSMAGSENEHHEDDKWSISSCDRSSSASPQQMKQASAAPTSHQMVHGQPSQQRRPYSMQVPPPEPPGTPKQPFPATTDDGLAKNQTRRASLRRRHRQPARVVVFGARKRRPAPLPPQPHRTEHRAILAAASCHNQEEEDSNFSPIDSDSGAGTGTHTYSSNSSTRDGSTSGKQDGPSPKLLSEAEAFSIEYALKSHKSSIYVCGCMANLYFTQTQLVNNGRCSRPATNGWQLSKTGVPVLTFDSGLTRNRSRRQLSISLTERGSGFVLWSDIIDHLSNYRAFSNQVLGCSGPGADERGKASNQATCDTFHVMYLSTNHRLMVGFSFDNATCARLFLKQIELVTSDPANIALTGPKLAHRLASRSRLGRLLLRSTTSAAPSAAKLKRNGAGQTKKSSEKSSKSKRRQSDTSQHHRYAETDYSWSTLKRAMRFGASSYKADRQQQHQETELSPIEMATVSPAFLPKPLALLATAGQVYSSGAERKSSASKKMPRKCDISAPCLFQHVTSVDLDGLDRLYSRSLVASTRSDAMGQANQYSGNKEDQQLARKEVEWRQAYWGHPAVAATPAVTLLDQHQISSISSHRKRPTSEWRPENSARSAVRESGEDAPADKTLSTTTAAIYNAASSSSSSFSSSSCYSSGESTGSPSSSGNPRPAHPAKATSAPQQRPLPPRPGPLLNNAQQQQQHQHNTAKSGLQADKLPAPPSLGSNSNKIQAIIRELEAQTSAELVDAKRKLMADIADQVIRHEARPNPASTLTASKSQVAATKTGCQPDGVANSSGAAAPMYSRL